MTLAPRLARRTVLAFLVALASLPAGARVTLESSTTDSSGGILGSNGLKVITAEGQSIIGAVRSGLISLETGILYSLRGGHGADEELTARLRLHGRQCAVSDGRSLTIIGTVAGSGLKAWTLEAAAGRHAASGFRAIANGSSDVSSSSLGVWSTAGLSGWQTLRLTAVDESTGAAVSSAEVFIGDPSNAFASNGSRLAWPDVVKHLVRPCDE